MAAFDQIIGTAITNARRAVRAVPVSQPGTEQRRFGGVGTWASDTAISETTWSRVVRGEVG